jgi:predicted TIM-barrel fold metal-dependent hydrolase
MFSERFSERVTRRELLVGGLTAALTVGRRTPAFGRASQPSTLVNFAVPKGSCDCHTHVIGDPARFPMAANRVYTPETASPEEMAALHRALHIERVVVVTPSFYGTDNSATLYGMKARGHNARGIAVIDDHTVESDLDAMDRLGVRGVRLNLATIGQNDPTVARHLFQPLAERVRRLNWHVQINTNLSVISAMKDLIHASAAPVVVDHFGGAQAASGISQPGWADLVDLVRLGKAYVKMSAEYSISTQAPDYPDVAPFVRALVAANADRVLWGSDWPHTNSKASRARSNTEVTPLTAVDDGRLLNQLAVWVPDVSLRKKILVDNPARLYGFGEARM